MKPPITVMCDRCGARNTHDDADYVHGRLWCAVCDAWTVHHAVGTLLAGVCDAAQPYWERRECELRRLLEGEGVHVYGLSEPCRTRGGTWWDGALTAEEDSCGGPVWWVEVWENLDVQATVMVLVRPVNSLLLAGPPWRVRHTVWGVSMRMASRCLIGGLLILVSWLRHGGVRLARKGSAKGGKLYGIP